MFKNFFLILMVSAFCQVSILSQPALARDLNNCECIYKLDKVNQDMYYVLKKDLQSGKCNILVLSKTSDLSPYLEKLKNEEHYEVIGKFKTFEGANFMAMGECTKCK